MNKRGKHFRTESIITYLFMFVLIGGGIGLIYFLDIGFTGFVVFIQGSQSDFNEGTYNNTIHNGTAVILSGTNSSGDYTSKVFDASGPAVWNNVTLSRSLSTLERLFTVDGQADIWKSTDFGTSWSLIKDDYNGGDGNGATYMVKNSSENLFILFNQDLWVSNDDGTSWTKVNDDYNGAEGQNAFVVDIGSNDNIYIIEGGQEVWKSTDSGASFIKISTDFNGGNGNIFGIAINSSDNIFIVDTQADIWKSTDSGENWILVKDDYNGGNSNDADDMVVNSSDALFILHNQDLWQSTNNGVNWTLVNDDFNGAGDSNSGKILYIDINDNIYIVDGSEDVYQSIDSGISFSLLVSNFNGGNGNIFGFTSTLQSTNLTFQVRNCSLSNCGDGTFIGSDGTVNTFYFGLTNDINLQSRYFQYKIYFSSEDSSLTPELFNFTLDYSSLAPEVNITSPKEGEGFNYNTSLPLNFTITNATTLDTCWYTLDGGISNTTILNCQNTTFNASDGNYELRLYSNDTFGNTGSDSVNFTVSAIGVSLTVTEPSGTKSSRTGVPITFSVVGNNLTCWYNVKTSIGGEVIGNTTLANCFGSSFDVSSDGDYSFNLFANNSLGALDSATSSFTVSTSSTSPPSSGGGGGGGGGSTTIIQTTNITSRLTVNPIFGFIADPGESKTIIWKVKNTGTSFLNDCKFESFGDYLSWISYGETKSLSAGEEYAFIFDLNIPEEIGFGSYGLGVVLNCKEASNFTKFNVEIIEKKLQFDLLEVVRENDGGVKVSYSLEELSGIDQEVRLEFLFFEGNEKVAETLESKFILANSKNEFESFISVDSSLEGNLNLLINLNSETYSTFVQENIILGAPISGFAIFGDLTKGNSIISYVLIILFFIFAAVIIRRIFKFRSHIKHGHKNRKKVRRKK